MPPDPPAAPDRGPAMPAQLMAKVDSWWKLGGALFAIISGSVALGITLGGYAQLPASVRANTARIVTLEANERNASNEREEIREGIARLQCLVLASRRETPIEDCL